jgi:putative DNA primase/helicase
MTACVQIPENARKEWREALRAKPEPTRKIYSRGMKDFMLLQFPKRRCLLKPWLTTAGLSALFAEPGVGKTRLALSVGYAVASGTSLLGWQCEHRAPVLFVDGELPGELLQQWVSELGPTLPDEDFQILSYSDLEMLQGARIPDLGTQEGRDFLDQHIEAHKSELVILDSISTLVRSGVENDAESWRVVQDWSLKHRARGRHVLYLHHTGRSGKMRGTSMREIVIDIAVRLKELKEESTETETAVELSYEKGRHLPPKDKVPKIVHFGVVDGCVCWRGAAKAPAHSERVAEMLEQGYEHGAIAKELGISKGRVSQIKKALQEKGGV